MMLAWQTSLRHGASDPIKEVFSIDFQTVYKCAESDETFTETASEFVVKCNITADINHLADGIKLGLINDREKNSEALQRSVLWHGAAKVAKLPPYLTVQLMRFFYKQATQARAKIMRSVRTHSPTRADASAVWPHVQPRERRAAPCARGCGVRSKRHKACGCHQRVGSLATSNSSARTQAS
jgi:Ubiquitin carboxyl-terminal hydrolase